jgi:ubiquinone/menaquinone biosynthesis C-methylase UbiE
VRRSWGPVRSVVAVAQRERGPRKPTVKEDEYRSGTIRAFDRWAKFYDRFVSLFRLGRVRREAVETSGVGRGDRVLDVCTGTGGQALLFATRSDYVTGIDLSAGMLAAARKKDMDGSVHFLRMDASRLAFFDKVFEVSSIAFALHDMPPEVREGVLREMARVTKDRIVIVDYNPPQNRFLRSLYTGLISLYESKYFTDFVRGDFEALLAGCGLRMERQKAVWLGLVRICLCRAQGPEFASSQRP